MVFKYIYLIKKIKKNSKNLRLMKEWKIFFVDDKLINLSLCYINFSYLLKFFYALNSYSLSLLLPWQLLRIKTQQIHILLNSQSSVI